MTEPNPNPDHEPRAYSLDSGSGPMPEGWEGDLPPEYGKIETGEADPKPESGSG